MVLGFDWFDPSFRTQDGVIPQGGKPAFSPTATLHTETPVDQPVERRLRIEEIHEENRNLDRGR